MESQITGNQGKHGRRINEGFCSKFQESYRRLKKAGMNNGRNVDSIVKDRVGLPVVELGTRSEFLVEY